MHADPFFTVDFGVPCTQTPGRFQTPIGSLMLIIIIMIMIIKIYIYIEREREIDIDT